MSELDRIRQSVKRSLRGRTRRHRAKPRPDMTKRFKRTTRFDLKYGKDEYGDSYGAQEICSFNEAYRFNTPRGFIDLENDVKPHYLLPNQWIIPGIKKKAITKK